MHIVVTLIANHKCIIAPFTGVVGEIAQQLIHHLLGFGNCFCRNTSHAKRYGSRGNGIAGVVGKQGEVVVAGVALCFHIACGRLECYHKVVATVADKVTVVECSSTENEQILQLLGIAQMKHLHK